jgi:hypothetical protein
MLIRVLVCTFCGFCSVDELRVLSEEELVERALREAMEVTVPIELVLMCLIVVLVL